MEIELFKEKLNSKPLSICNDEDEDEDEGFRIFSFEPKNN